MANHRLGAQQHPTGGQGPGQGDATAAGPGPAGAAVQGEAAGVDQGQTQLLGQALLQPQLAGGKGQGGLELTVRQLVQAIPAAMHPQQLLQAAVVGVQVGMANRPAGPMAIALSGFELVIGQPQGDPPPAEAFTAHLATAAPQEGGIGGGGVGVGPLVGEQLWILFPVAGVM